MIMQRTIPRTSTDTINLFMRTYYSLLRTTDAVPIQSLVEGYMAMESSLHVHARNENMVDVSALVYTGLRLPTCITQVDTVLVGQTEDVFESHGYDVGDWEQVSAPGRRRRMHWDGNGTLAVFLSSRSDLDDLIPMLTAYQIEWNKIHERLRFDPIKGWLDQHSALAMFSESESDELVSTLGVQQNELMRLNIALGSNFIPTIKAMSSQRKHFKLRQLAGSLADYRKAYARWWHNVREAARPYDLEDVPIYFISSNLHSVVNLLSGFAVQERDGILSFLNEAGAHDLLKEYETIQSDEVLASNEPNFLYYSLKKYIAHHPEIRERQAQADQAIGLVNIPARRGFDVGAQVIPIKNLMEKNLDPRLNCLDDFSVLKHSNAMIINIDYPLGVSAYELLSYVSSRVSKLMGVYVMGKAATLNGRIGDVMIPNVVYDEHSGNTYLFSNCFSARHVTPYMTVGSVLDNQKAVTTYGTFLQNPDYMDVFYQEGYTIVEMEAGPYLSAVYECVRPRRHPSDEIVRLYEAPMEIGVLHYASDTPFSKGHNLGAGSLGYTGVEATYGTAVSILRRILQAESERLMGSDKYSTRVMKLPMNGWRA